MPYVKPTRDDFRGRTHDCPGGCGRRVAQINFACKKCWFRLPEDIRKLIWKYFNKDTGGHASALSMADDWYREHPLREN
jgi:hypothetical protein